jgi:hypothetical protein
MRVPDWAVSENVFFIVDKGNFINCVMSKKDNLFNS